MAAMRHGLSPLVIGVTVLILEVTAPIGCLGPSPHATAIDDKEDRYVRVETRTSGRDSGIVVRLAHPMTLNEADWRQLLKGIEMTFRTQLFFLRITPAVRHEAFDKHDQQYLASRLAEALATAESDEWVVFYLSHPREPGVAEITSGIFFAEGERLHVLFANYRYVASMPFLQQSIRENPLRPSGDGFAELVARPYQTVLTEHSVHLSKPLFARVLELAINYRAFLADPNGIAAQNHGPAPSGAEDDAITKLEDKLRALQRLREQRLITEEEYRETRERLLGAL